MSSPNTPPVIITPPPLPTMDVPSRVVELHANAVLSQAQRDKASDQKSADKRQDQAAEVMAETDHLIRLHRLLGAKALGQRINPADYEGPEGIPEVKTAKERKLDDKIFKRTVAHRKAVGKERVTTVQDRRGLGKKRRIATLANKVGVRVFTKKSGAEKAAAIRQTKIPKRKVPKYEQKAVKDLEWKDALLKMSVKAPLQTVLRERKFKHAKETIMVSHKRSEKARQDGELLEVESAFRKIDKATNKKARAYNKEARRTNLSDRKYTKRANRLSRLDDQITTTEARTGKEARLIRKVRSANARLVQRSLTRSTTSRANAADKKLGFERSQRQGAQQKRDIGDYLTLAAQEQAETRRVRLTTEDTRRQREARIRNSDKLTLEEAYQALSYGDVFNRADPSEAPQSAAVMNQVINSESGRKYARALQDLVGEYGKEALITTSKTLVEECKEQLAKFGIEPSRYGKSISWALWDMAKQSYFVNNRTEADPNYSIADAMTDPTKLAEVLDRHIGWEMFKAVNNPDLTAAERDALLADPRLTSEVKALLNKPPKPENGELSSRDSAELGRLLRLTPALVAVP